MVAPANMFYGAQAESTTAVVNTGEKTLHGI